MPCNGAWIFEDETQSGWDFEHQIMGLVPRANLSYRQPLLLYSYSWLVSCPRGSFIAQNEATVLTVPYSCQSQSSQVNIASRARLAHPDRGSTLKRPKLPPAALHRRARFSAARR